MSAAAPAWCRSRTPGLVVGRTGGAARRRRRAIALSADGTTAWVTQQAGSIVPVTLASGTVGTPIHLGGHPSAIVDRAG